MKEIGSELVGLAVFVVALVFGAALCVCTLGIVGICRLCYPDRPARITT